MTVPAREPSRMTLPGKLANLHELWPDTGRNRPPRKRQPPKRQAMIGTVGHRQSGGSVMPVRECRFSYRECLEWCGAHLREAGSLRLPRVTVPAISLTSRSSSSRRAKRLLRRPSSWNGSADR